MLDPNRGLFSDRLRPFISWIRKPRITGGRFSLRERLHYISNGLQFWKQLFDTKASILHDNPDSTPAKAGSIS
jgi:hypothetical protein